MSATAGLLGGWGREAHELLEGRHGPTVFRRGPLSLVERSTTTATGSWSAWVAGTLFNGAELKNRLEVTGEVDGGSLVAIAHERFGEDAVLQLRGSFVLVALDVVRDRAIVARDQLGALPLVYMRVGEGALFAEHERDLVEVLPRTPPPDRLSVVSWADSGTLLPGRTLYQGVLRLRAGHRLVLSTRGLDVERYWSPRYQPRVEGPRATVAESLREEAFDAVARACGDVRSVGVRLSGGLDSSCVAAGLAARRGPDSANLAFSAVFPRHAEIDESELIAATARHAGLRLTLASMEGRDPLLRPAVEHVLRWRLPPTSPNLALSARIGRLARQAGVEVLLDGEGGDELFGMSPYLIADMIRAGRLAEAWRLSGLMPGMGSHPTPRIRFRALRFFGARGMVPAGLWRRRARREAASSTRRLAAQADALALVSLRGDPGWRELDGPHWWRSLAAALSERDRTLDVSGHLRRQSLDAGVESRHPFLYDVALISAVLGNPPELQFDPVRDRPLLRDGLAGHIPEAVRTRHEKSFFNGLLDTSLAGEGHVLASNLASPASPLREYVDRDRLDSLLTEAQEQSGGRRDMPRRLWHAGIADLWLRSLDDHDSLAELASGSPVPESTRLPV